MTFSKHAVAVAATIWIAAIAADRPSAQPTPRVDFARDVKPILEARCLACHDRDKRKGGLSLATYGDALDGGRNGAAIRPGNAAGSLLVHRIAGEIEPQMPKDEDPLTPPQLAIIRRWIEQGAPKCRRPGGAGTVGSALELTRSTVPAIRWPHGRRRSIASSPTIWVRRRAPTAARDARCSPVVLPDVWGLLLARTASDVSYDRSSTA
jgi:hypothetical protein